MAVTATRVLLSGSTNGRAVKVAATATAGTLIHTSATGTTTWDEIWLWAFNTDTNTIKLTLEWGGTTSPDDTIEQYLAPESGAVLVAPGLNLNNSVVVRAFAGTANVVGIVGYVNRLV